MRSEFSKSITVKRTEDLAELFTQSGLYLFNRDNKFGHSFKFHNIPNDEIEVKSVCLDIDLHGEGNCEIGGTATKKGLKLLKGYCDKVEAKKNNKTIQFHLTNNSE